MNVGPKSRKVVEAIASKTTKDKKKRRGAKDVVEAIATYDPK